MESQENLEENVESRVADWLDKLTRRQKRKIFKQDSFSNRVKKLLK